MVRDSIGSVPGRVVSTATTGRVANESSARPDRGPARRRTRSRALGSFAEHGAARAPAGASGRPARAAGPPPGRAADRPSGPAVRARPPPPTADGGAPGGGAPTTPPGRPPAPPPP